MHLYQEWGIQKLILFAYFFFPTHKLMLIKIWSPSTLIQIKYLP